MAKNLTREFEIAEMMFLSGVDDLNQNAQHLENFLDGKPLNAGPIKEINMEVLQIHKSNAEFFKDTCKKSIEKCREAFEKLSDVKEIRLKPTTTSAFHALIERYDNLEERIRKEYD